MCAMKKKEKRLSAYDLIHQRVDNEIRWKSDIFIYRTNKKSVCEKQNEKYDSEDKELFMFSF